jgi:hypothetical protein
VGYFCLECIGLNVKNLLSNLETVVFGSRTVLEKITDGSETIILTYTALITADDLTTGESDPPGQSSH